jgi:lipopolysaccharide assembly protein A
MRIVTWGIWLVVFLLLAAFAARNAQQVELRFFFDRTLSAPLVVLLLAFFAIGALFGVLALVGTLLRQRREISNLKKQSVAAPVPPPPPPF